MDPVRVQALMARFRTGSCGATAALKKARLTPAEVQVLRLVAQGFANPEIARELGTELSTVKTHVHRLLAKLDLSDRVRAVVWAFQNGVVPKD